MHINYAVYDPMGNITVLVTSPVPVPLRGAAAKHLMEIIPDAEQVGFLCHGGGQDIGKDRLEMAGGEFCGNAAMSAAARIADAQGISAGQSVALALEVSGADRPVSVHVLRSTGNHARPDEGSGAVQGTKAAVFECTVEMPLPATVEIFDTALDEISISLPLVRLPGIAHFVVRLADDQIFDEAFRETVQRQLRELSAKVDAEAYGLIFIGAEDAPILPLLYVPAADTMVWENACGSGSAAAAAWLSAERGTSVSVRLPQPGGGVILARAKTVLVTPGQAARVTELSVTGRVLLRESGETTLPAENQEETSPATVLLLW